MTAFNLGKLLNSSVWSVYRMRDRIDLDPVYQREGDIWTMERRQLLIDTIINGFDVPKIYMHKFPDPVPGREMIDYAVIDGKQRLKAIWDFIGGSFALHSDFSYFRDERIQLASLTYADIAREYPDIKADLDSYSLDIITIETSDIELIEDMFSRLNEAMPLNAAEKRNARPGPLPPAVRAIVKGAPLFTTKLPFTNRRYRHFDLAAKMLLLASRDTVADTKKAYIDAFFERHARASHDDVSPIVEKTGAVLDAMADVFTDSDPLLRSIGMVMLYFLLCERALERNNISRITRPALLRFEDLRAENRQAAENDIASADYDLLEFDRYTQSPNDGVALRFRLSVIDRKAFGGQLGFGLPS